MNDDAPAPPARPRFRPEVARLGVVCGVLYFAQGLCEPGTGMMKQPVNSLLDRWGYEAAGITVFQFWLGLPWYLKLVYGLISDFVPLFGYRRKSWLLLTCFLTFVSFGLLAWAPSLRDSYGSLLAWMLVANFCVAFSDVVIDATMVEQGQPLGATGRLQSIQWGAMSLASAIGANAGGLIAEHSRQQVGFAVCCVFAAVSVGVILFGLREKPYEVPEQNLGSALRTLGLAARSRTLLAVAAFLFLWNFNPFSADVLYYHLRHSVGLSETDCGNADTVYYVFAGLGSLAYAMYCRRVPFRWQLHLTILLGVLATVGYWGLAGKTSAYVIAGAVGAVYMTATVMQLDLAARACPPQVAGTAFALLMAISNLGISAAGLLGGDLYTRWSKLWGSGTAFNLLVATGAAFTAASWLLAPVLLKHEQPQPVG